jgi:isopentenyl-diphosphate delta-isomerase
MSKVTPDSTDSSLIESRKVDHIRINLEQNVQFPRLKTGLERFRFMHRALPEINMSEIDTEVEIFGKKLAAPLLISSMTGGTSMAQQLNERLAIVAQHERLAIGLGSQRAALRDPSLIPSYQVRHVAPDALVFANVGAVQLNYGVTVADCRRIVDMVEADALILHFNVLQEAVQPEGDTDFSGLLSRVAEVCELVGVPVIAKEVGWGFSERDVRGLVDAGVSAIDVAGAGGTSWSEVEFHRAPTAFHAQVAAAFADWGIPTADALRFASHVAPDRLIFASGGLRDGIDVAKSIALGAHLGGLASPFLRAADHSLESAFEFARVLVAQLRISMLCAGVSSISDLRRVPLVEVPS